MWNLTKTLLGQDDQNVIIKQDPHWGFCEFPAPGDAKKHLLPVLIDPEEASNRNNPEEEEKHTGKQLKQFWMPDKFCKVCYACEEPFTMYRRRHHCRMCGQVFCNNCSSYSIDGALFNTPGLVRACQVCYEQANEKIPSEAKLVKRKPLEKTLVDIQNAQIRELNAEYKNSNKNLQERASNHLTSIVDRLIDTSTVITNERKIWKETVVNLVKVVVSSVDPDVRSGDNLDIRPYVKIKVIPGGTMSECVYVDGVVFRKNVSHKKMSVDGAKPDPRILLLAGGIEFQRTEAKLASMDTLIEQEDKFMEILVEKIMSLKPDIILVGKAVARKAQELLCEHKVLVMQNVKQTILERVARMTGAMLLPSTDSMIKQFGEECLGTCGKFWMRLVQDDPERSNDTQTTRILRTRISRASTYAYIEGCPSERGCTIVLRGGNRPLLAEVKRIIRFSILVAYHLRLEVAYYNDRFADLPLELDDTIYDDSSDIDDEVVDDENYDYGEYEDTNPTLVSFLDQNPAAKVRKERYYISTSMDIDFNIPYRKELIGTTLFRNKTLTKFHIESHQSLLITSLLMLENTVNSTPMQKTPADVKGIKYYTKHDVALGAFIIENCFQLGRNNHLQRESRMLDQTLSFAHKSGRIDISVKKATDGKGIINSAAMVVASDREDTATTTSGSGRDPLHLPLFISSFCRECGRIVTPQHILSEEVWKMSFGKFLELLFYNRSARCTIGGCNHSLRDCHILSFTCENYVATFEFFPIHPFTLNVREKMSFPDDFYWKQTLIILNQLPEKHSILMEDFRLAISVLEREVQDILSSRPDDLSLAIADVQLMSNELNNVATRFYEELLRTYESLPKRYQDKEAENRIRNILNDRLNKIAKADRPLSVSFTAEMIQQNVLAAHSSDISGNGGGVPPDRSSISDVVTVSIAPTEIKVPTQLEDGVADDSDKSVTPPNEEGHNPIDVVEEVYPTEFNAVVAALFPMIHFRDTFLKACRWNTRIDTIYKFLESVRNMLIQQLQAKEQSVISEKVNPTGHGVASIVSTMYNNADADELDSDYQSHRKHLAEVVSADLARNVDLPPAITAAHVHDMSSVKSLPPKDPKEEDVFAASNRETRVSVADGIPTAVLATDSTASNVVPAPHATPVIGMNNLYRAALEQNRRASDRPVDKMSRITKALQRFLVGNKDSTEEQSKFFVPLGEFGIGRYGLKPGRNGVVVPVSEDVLASIIAYTLASNEYYEDLQASIREDTIENNHDIEGIHDLETNTGTNAAMSEEEKRLFENDFVESRSGKGTKTLQGQQFNSSANDYLDSSTNSANSGGLNSPSAGSDVFSLGQTIMGPFKRSTMPRVESNPNNALPAVPEGEEEEEEDLDKSPSVSPVRTHQKGSARRGLHSLMKNFPNEELSTGHDVSMMMNAGAGISGFGASSGFENSSVDSNSVNEVNNGSVTPNSTGGSNKGPTAVISNVTNNIQEGVKKLFVSSEATTNESGSDRKDPSSVSAASGTNAAGTSTPGVGGVSSHQTNLPHSPSQGPSSNLPLGSDGPLNHNMSANEKQMTSQDKSNIRHRFDDYDDRGNLVCKFQCQVYFAKQFEAVRNCYFGEEDQRDNFIRSLAMSAKWSAQGGKSGASFSKTMDERLICKQISRVELQMFVDFAPAYFEYMAKAYYHNLPTVLCKILGVYTVRYDNKETNKKGTENIVVMENIFYERNITTTFDLKGSSRARYVELLGEKKEFFDDAVFKRRRARRKQRERAQTVAESTVAGEGTFPPAPDRPRDSTSLSRLTMTNANPNSEHDMSEQEIHAALQPAQHISQVLLDDNLMEFTKGRPFPLKHRAKLFFHKAVQNDTLFLSIVNVVDYSILVGFDENKHEMVVGIIDYLRQYDIIKKMERVGKGSVGMLTGQAEPTIIQPSQYRKRFTLAMERYFMTIPDKWISYDT